ncbi:MAG: ABC transporter permease [Betaproteobacteria bacterium]|nr:MAG: ABC transporter permease [Betaproteobacteria bacterium]
MPFQPVILWTDALVFLLLLGVAGVAVYVRRHDHLRQPWKRVSQSASGMVGAVVLVFLVLIGVLDSLHFRARLDSAIQGQSAYAVEISSVLDRVLRPLKERPEKTYSAPLAYRLYARETIELPDGRQGREYPRLRHGGSHLDSPEREWASDIGRRTLAGAAIGFVLWFLAGALVCACIARTSGDGVDQVWRTLLRGDRDVPWRAILITLGAVLIAASIAAVLAGKYHVLGTSKVGEDVLYQAMKSLRTALVIGTLTTLVMLPFAVLLGIAAGYFKGWTDDIIQYVYTTLNSIPAVLLIAAAVLMMQVYIDTRPESFPTAVERADLRLLFLCAILGVTSWTGLCRLLRGETLKIRELDYIQAAQAFGVGHLSIITRHIFPNVMHIVLIAVVMEFSGLVLAEAVLSYVGVGVDPSMISFGTMINAARLEMARDPMVWWSLAAAFGFMFVLVLSANLFADAVRDAFDPRVAVKPFRLRLGAIARRDATT